MPPLFSEDDIGCLELTSGRQVIEGADRRVLAAALTAAFDRAAFHAHRPESHAAVLRQHAAIHAATRRLLEVLGTGDEARAQAGARLRNTTRLRRLIEDAATDGAFRREKGGDLQPRLSALPGLEAMLADLELFAGIAMSYRASQPANPRGRPSVAGLDSLFQDLACAYLAFFGIQPPSANRRARSRMKNAHPSGQWVAEICGLAVFRTHQRTDDDWIRLRESLGEIKTTRGFADKLVAGYQQWASRPDHDRWDPVVWHPSGRPPNQWAPKWIVENDISSPKNV